MITQNKRGIQSPMSNSNNSLGQTKSSHTFAIPGTQTNGLQQSKKKSKKESKKNNNNNNNNNNHQRKLSDNRIYYNNNQIVINNTNINGQPILIPNNLIHLDQNSSKASNNNTNNNLNFIHNQNIHHNIIQNNNNTNSNSQFYQANQNYQTNNEHYHSNNSPSSHQYDEESGSSDSNQDIKNKLLNLLTQKNDSKKIIPSKSSGNSLDFAIGEFGKRKKSPQSQISSSNNYNLGISNNHYHAGKKSPSNNKNLLYFQDKSTNKSQIQNNSSHYILSPKESRNAHNIFQYVKPSQKRDHQYINNINNSNNAYQNQVHQQQQQLQQSPLITTVMKSKGLSPENHKDSFSPSKENLMSIIAAQKHINPRISPHKIGAGHNTSHGNLALVDSKAALKKKLSVPKLLNQDLLSYLSKRDNSKDKIISLFNTKHEALTDHNTRKNSTLSKKHKSVSPENHTSMQQNIKQAIGIKQHQHSQQQLLLQQQLQQQQTQKKKPGFKKYRPPDLEEIQGQNTISQSVPNSSKHNIQNTFNTPNNNNNQNLNNNYTSQMDTTKKFYFDNNLTSQNSQFIHSQSINANNPIQNINLTNTNQLNNAATMNSYPNNNSQNMNNISGSANYSNSARSNNQMQQNTNPHSHNQLYQNYINPYINNSNNQSKIITAAISYNLKNAENRLMKIQEDMFEGGEQSNNQMNEQLQKTFLRTSKLLNGYKARELKWEQEKKVLVDEIKFLKNLLYTEQFDDLVINNQMNCFITHILCFTLVICLLS